MTIRPMLEIAVSLFCASILAAPLAQALPVITFSGVANGANVADFYNGGTDSTGYAGVNYGIHFDAVIANNVAGPYVKGHASMSFAANMFGENVPFYILFNASNYAIDPVQSFINGDYTDSVWVGGNGNPYCQTEAQCQAIGSRYVYHSTMGGYYFSSDGSATSVTFNTDRLDNISFVLASEAGSNPRPSYLVGSAELDRDIPEPAPTALLGIGALMLVLRRKTRAST
jgi:hypothetical protein